ncbi:ricin B-like lectin [Ceratobasidium sp. AG-I]|nr:ricin B-like lectin [Ceratobasidium sp. AG-I]
MGREANGTTVHLWDKTGAKQQKWCFEKINDNSGGGGGGGGGYQPPPQQHYQPPPQQQYQPPPQQQQPPAQQPQQPPQQQQPPPQQQQPPPQQQQPVQTGPISPGTYTLKNVKTGTVLDLSGGHGNEGADVIGYHHNGGNNQKWQVQPTGHGQNVTIRNLESNSFAAFPGQSFAQGVLVKGSSQSQEYTIAAADKGFFISPTQQPGYVLDLVNGSDKNGTKICVWQNNQQDNQKWYFERA